MGSSVVSTTFLHIIIHDLFLKKKYPNEQHLPVTGHQRIQLWHRCRSAAGKFRTCQEPWAGAIRSAASQRPGAGQPVRRTRIDVWSPGRAPWPVRHGSHMETCPSTRPTVAPTGARIATADPVEENRKKTWLNSVGVLYTAYSKIDFNTFGQIRWFELNFWRERLITDLYFLKLTFMPRAVRFDNNYYVYHIILLTRLCVPTNGNLLLVKHFDSVFKLRC